VSANNADDPTPEGESPAPNDGQNQRTRTDLLAILWPTEPPGEAWLSLCLKHGHDRSARPPDSDFYQVSRRDLINEHKIAFRDQFNIWFSVCALGSRPLVGRGPEDQIAFVPALWADLDDNNAPGVNILELLTNLAPVVVATGNGYHAYWPFVEPFEIKTPADRFRIKELNERLRQWLGDVAGGVTFDNVGDLSRILRVPGTLNHKTDPPKPVEIMWAYDRRFTVDQLDASLPALREGSSSTRTLSDEEEREAFARQGSLNRDEAQAIIDRLLPQYVERARSGKDGGRDWSGFYFAQQLNDHYVPRGMANEALREYSRRVPEEDATGRRDPFTEKEGEAKANSAYKIAPRGPIVAPGGLPATEQTLRFQRLDEIESTPAHFLTLILQPGS
jgi:hypothetical protein